MKLARHPEVHLTYCTNIHPGETWQQVRTNLETHVVAVKQKLCPDRPFGVGLRLSSEAARSLARPEALAIFRELLAARGLYVFTINGFAYGAFHGTVVKERVYRPDWLEDERLRYSDRLAELLAALLPADDPKLEGSVSTVPGCYLDRRRPADAEALIAERLRRHAAALFRLRERTGRTVGLALEPEPHCLLETTGDATVFFEDLLFSRSSCAAFAELAGVSAASAEEILRRHLGVCLDACHAAVEFEHPREAVARLAARGIRILKIQVSSGLRVERPGPEALAALAQFAEGVYLHQAVIRRNGNLVRFADLPEALRHASPGDAGEEWRVHFHVPVHRERLGRFTNTQPFLSDLLSLQADAPVTRHLEVETYTWEVLPKEYRREPLDRAIARELAWTLARLGEPLSHDLP